MGDELLEYYNSELSYIRKLGLEFARAHPDVASMLRLDSGPSQDPYVERMLEGFAYLTARVRKKIDDEFPEIAQAFLGVLYPHFLAPIPSMSICQFELGAGQSGLVGGYHVPRGTELETEEVDGESCRYRTAFDLNVLPLRVGAAEVLPLGRKLDAKLAHDPQTVLRIRLSAVGPDGPISKLNCEKLRFFIAGEPIHANAIYEALFTDVVGVALATRTDDPAMEFLPQGAWQPCGFAENEAILPFEARSFTGYRLLTEYFSFPERFRFFELSGLSPQLRSRFTSTMEVLLFLKRRHEVLQRNVNTDTFRLGCSPIVNLFEQRVDPFPLHHRRSRYPIVPDIRRTVAREVYSIDRVDALKSDGTSQPVLPFFALDHSRGSEKGSAYWYASRQGAGYQGGRFDPATEIELALVDLNFQPTVPADWTINVSTTCLNRDLPSRLLFGGDRPTIRLRKGGAPLTLRLLTPPTPTRRSELREGTLWKLISHLSLNHLSLVEGERGAEALRELLTLYDVVRSAETSAKIQGIRAVHSRRVTQRIWSGSTCGFARGVEVSVDFDEERFADRGLYLFASVLERFLSLYCTVNSFTQFVALSSRREDGVLHKWESRTSENPLL